MSDAPPAPGSAPGTEARHLLSADLEAARSFMGLSRGWWSGSTAPKAWFWTLALASMILVNVGVNVLMNGWHGWFFNALERKDGAAASMAMAAFPLIVVAAAAVGVMILKTRETLQVHWRQWLRRARRDEWQPASGRAPLPSTCAPTAAAGLHRE